MRIQCIFLIIIPKLIFYSAIRLRFSRTQRKSSSFIICWNAVVDEAEAWSCKMWPSQETSAIAVVSSEVLSCWEGHTQDGSAPETQWGASPPYTRSGLSCTPAETLLSSAHSCLLQPVPHQPGPLSCSFRTILLWAQGED